MQLIFNEAKSMSFVKVQFHPAEREYLFGAEFTESTETPIFKVGDWVMAETSLGQDLAMITWQGLEKPEEFSAEDIKPLLRMAKPEEHDQKNEQKKENAQLLKDCEAACQKNNLNMKLIDVHQSLDGTRLTFYFISESRVDFRDLVKDLISKFHKKIRLQQIGVRDEAKICGDYGPCGLPLCCKNWLKSLGNVNAEYIKDQDLMHRGNERLSGVCGRLKCCLRYEEEAYKYALGQLPKVGDEIKTKAGMAKVISVHPLKQTVDLKIDGAIVEYPYLEGKLCRQEPGSCDGCMQN